MNNFLKKYIHWIVLASILLMVISPYVLTRSVGLTSFKDTGNIGDTIGGLTAPVIGLLSALLVYLSFQAQIDANKLFYQARQEDLLISNINNWTDKVIKSVDNYQYGKITGSLAVITALRDVNMRMKEAEIRHKQGREKAFKEKFDSLVHEYYISLASIINDINTLLRYIEEKNIPFETYEINLTLISSYIESYFTSANDFSLLLKKYQDVYKPGPPYYYIDITHTKELLKRLRRGHSLSNVRVMK